MDEKTLENLKGLHQSYWGKSSFADRLNALQRLEDYQADQQGRASYEVKTFEGDPSNIGFLALDNDKFEDGIYINQKNITDDLGQYQAINTVLHEGRHAYQFTGIHHDLIEQEKWTVNSNSENYIDFKEDYVKYFFQPLERDANFFSKEEMNRIFAGLESGFGESAGFGTYAKLRDQQFQFIERQAENRWGKNYIQEVDKAIGIDEVQIRENLIKVTQQLFKPMPERPMPNPTAEELFWEIKAEQDYRNEKLEDADPKKPYIPVSFSEVMNERLAELGYQPGTASYDQFVEEIEYERREIETGYEEVDDHEWIEQYTDKKYAQAWDRLTERERIPQLEARAEAEVAYHERARYQEQVEKLEERFEKDPSPELGKQVQSMKEGLQTYMDREGETWGDYVKSTLGKGQEGLIVDAKRNNVVIEATLKNGAYVRPADDRTKLGYVPFMKDEQGLYRIDGEKIQWNRNQKINLSIETDEKRGKYIRMQSKDSGASARAYLDGEAKPFKDLKNQWEIEGKTFRQNKERNREMEQDRGMER